MEGIGKVLGEIGVLLQLWPEFTDGELVILGHLDGGHGILLHQHLFASKDLF